jgi:class 3 adenylate cyclase
MLCPSCGQDSPEQASFCMYCGISLGREQCVACSAPVPNGAAFCPGCGMRRSMGPKDHPSPYTPTYLAKKILTNRRTMEGELKQLTVLFVDVCGSMRLAEALGPEEWHGLLDRFFKLLARGIHRFEGTINQFTGDGIMALFGAPIAHEDHAVRACRAALWLRDEVQRYARSLVLPEGLEFDVRTALNSGEVVVGRIGDDLRMDYTAQGHSVGIAARLQELAPPGGIYLSDAVRNLVSGSFEFRHVGDHELKGVSHPIPVYALVGHSTAPRAGLQGRDLGPMVGREHELAVLERGLDQASTERGHVVTIVGEAGLGKSRLCYEFAQRCGDRGIAVLRARCASHGAAIPYLAIQELIRAHAGLLGGESPAEIVDRVTSACARFDEGAEFHLQLILELLGVASAASPAASAAGLTPHAHLSWLLRNIMAGSDGGRPSVIIVEDLHWIDSESEILIAEMAQSTPEARCLLVLNFRPEYEASWLQRTHRETLPIKPMDPDHVRALLVDLVGIDSSEAIARMIEDWADGNPFYAEEIVRSLVESGGLRGEPGAYELSSDLDTSMSAELVPASLQALLASRIDRLNDRPKEVLQLAAVTGRHFDRALLQQILELSSDELDRCLDTLRTAHFIRGASSDGTQLHFQHSLTQEVAYRSQLGALLRDRHAAIARALSGRESGGDGHGAEVAHHWEAAGEYLFAARARTQVALWLTDRGRLPASGEWRRAHKLALQLPDSPESQDLRLQASEGLIQLAWHEGISEQELSAAYAEANLLMNTVADLGRRSTFHVAYGRSLYLTADADAYLEQARIAADIAEGSVSGFLQIQAGGTIAQALLFGGRLAEGLESVDHHLGQLESDPDLASSPHQFRYDGWLRSLRARLLYLAGRLDESRTELDQVIEGESESSSWGLLEVAHLTYALVCGAMADPKGVEHHAQRLETMASEHGGPWALVSAGLSRGLYELQRARPDKAIQTLQNALYTARERRVGLEWESDILALLGNAHTAARDHRAALESVDEARRVAVRRKARTAESIACLARGRALMHSSFPEQARNREAAASLEQALDLARSTGARTLQAFAHLERAHLALRRGSTSDYDVELDAALGLFDAMGAHKRAALIRGHLGR